MKKTLAGIVRSCVLAASLTACGGSNNSASTSAEETSAAAGGSTSAAATTESGDKVIRVAAVDPQVALDPQQFTYSIVMKITDNITESLLTTTSDRLASTVLAASPAISVHTVT